MKRALVLCSTLACIVAASGALSGAAAADASAPRCLRNVDIDHTSTPNDQTILFSMKDGKVWRNDLQSACIGLTTGGYRYVSEPNDVICGRSETITSLQTHTMCQLGNFTSYPVPPGHRRSDPP